MKSELKQVLDTRPDLQPYLFSRGFLITDAAVDTSVYPFIIIGRGFRLKGVLALMYTISKR